MNANSNVATIARLPNMARRNRRWMVQDLALTGMLLAGLATASAIALSYLSQIL